MSHVWFNLRVWRRQGRDFILSPMSLIMIRINPNIWRNVSLSEGNFFHIYPGIFINSDYLLINLGGTDSIDFDLGIVVENTTLRILDTEMEIRSKLLIAWAPGLLCDILTMNFYFCLMCSFLCSRVSLLESTTSAAALSASQNCVMWHPAPALKQLQYLSLPLQRWEVRRYKLWLEYANSNYQQNFILSGSYWSSNYWH